MSISQHAGILRTSVAPQFVTEDQEWDLVITGTGLNEDARMDQIADTDWRDCQVPFSKFGISSQPRPNHPGTFVFTKVNGRPTIWVRGKVHLYQVYGQPENLVIWGVASPVLMCKGRRVINAHAVGGIKSHMMPKSIALPTDMVGIAFPDLIYLDLNDGHPAYESVLPKPNGPFITKASAYAKEVGIEVSSVNSVFVPVPGPCLGGRGDRRFCNSVFADTIGMSGKPEGVVFAKFNEDLPEGNRFRMGMIQVVTDNNEEPSDADIVQVAKEIAPKVYELIERLLADRNW